MTPHEKAGVLTIIFLAVLCFAIGFVAGSIQAANRERQSICSAECGPFWTHEESRCVCLDRRNEPKTEVAK